MVPRIFPAISPCGLANWNRAEVRETRWFCANQRVALVRRVVLVRTVLCTKLPAAALQKGKEHTKTQRHTCEPAKVQGTFGDVRGSHDTAECAQCSLLLSGGFRPANRAFRQERPARTQTLICKRGQAQRYSKTLSLNVSACLQWP